MNETKLSPDDPRLTAYALGELEGDERMAVEAVLKTDAAARAAVDEIRATARQLEAALAAEPMPEFKTITAPLAQRVAIIPGRDPAKFDGGPWPWRNLIKFPQAYYLVGGLAAACFAVMVTLHESQVMRMEEQRRAAIAANNEAAQEKAAREMEFKKSAALATAAKPTSYAEVTFPVPSIPAGRVELQPQLQAVTADKTAALGASIASNQLADAETVGRQAFDAAAAPARGYSAAETMAATRVNTATRDLPFAVSATAGGFEKRSAALPPRTSSGNFNTETDADHHAGSDFLPAAQSPLSTFALDVDTASYANVRRFLQAGERPPADAVHIEELVNSFPYAYAAPCDPAPLAATLEVAAAPWAPAHRLVRIGLKAREIADGGTPVAVAKDVTVQVEFNPVRVQAYRLIGYDHRVLKKEDFNNDAITAGDVGAGHTVTALYEIVPAGVKPPAMPGVEALKYRKPEAGSQRADTRERKTGNSKPELLTVKVRYTPIEGGAGQQLEFPLTDHGAAFAEASTDFKFAAAVAGFGLILRESPLKGNATLAAVEQWAGQGRGADAGGYRAEFIGLVHQAEKLKE
ncbi:MAG TPA: von Willebrand factor type A domain-containing protein [Opitutaceae bacterium]|nr:von Willebrand factor type A domain-containing protein [Opitutaceae bacterium]